MKVQKILRVSLAVTGTLSVVLTLASFFGSKLIASLFLADQRAYYAMLAITPIAPIIAISSVLKGYFQGKQHMKSIAYSHVIEHLVQITCIMVLVQILLPYGIEYAVAGAMTSTVLGEGIGLLYLLTKFKKFHKKIQITKQKFTHRLQQGKQTFFELLHMGLPTTGHGFIHSISSAFQPMLVMKSLAIAGIGTAAATKQYGLLAGYVFPLLFLPGFITHSLSTALMPAISEAGANRDSMLMHRRIDQAMRIALMVGAPSTVILYVWATPLTTVIYHAPEAGQLLKIMAPVFLLHYFESPLHAVLLGLGKANTVMWNFIITTVFEAIAIFILGSKFGILGIVLGINFGISFLTLLNFFSISGIIGFYLDLRKMIKMAICMAVMAVSGQSMMSFMQHAEYGLLWSMLASISLSLVVFFILLLLTKTVQQKEIQHLSLFKRMASLGKHDA